MIPGTDPRLDIAVKKVVGSEELLVTQLVGRTLTVLRAQNGTLPGIHAAGDVIEQTEIEYSPVGFLADSGLPSLPSSWLSATYITTYRYDQQGRLRKTIDPLTDGDPAIPDEAGASPATVEYSFDAARNATKVTSTSRTGVSTAQWFDAAGRLVREENAPHGVTSYEYDLAGNLTAREFTPASSDTLPVQRTTFQYDGLGRQRAVIQHGSEPSFTATDYLRLAMSPERYLPTDMFRRMVRTLF